MRSTKMTTVFMLAFAAWSIISMVGPSAMNACVLNQDEYEFVKDTERWVVLIQGDKHSIGKLDGSGNFLPDKRWLRQKPEQMASMVPPSILINSPGQKGVYEFRSGRLIPGDIDESANFVPTVGGRIIDFKDFRYSPKAPKIYNLPGKFVRKEKKDGKK